MLNLLGFVYYNKIQDYIKRRKGSKDKEVSRKVRAKERRSNNNK
jgi:hypothetical protein